jgi:anti-sigma factor RsiW
MNAAHPSDEQLSAYLDGEADEAVAGHVEGCAVCAAGLDQLREVVALVATPIQPPGADVRQRAIAVALAAQHGERHRAEVIPMARRRARVPGWVLPAAAAVAAVLLAVPVISSMGGGGSAKKATSAASATTAAPLNQEAADTAAGAAATTTTVAASSSGALASPAAPNFQAGVVVLGSVTDAAELRTRVNDHLLAPPASEKRAASATTANKSTAATPPTACSQRAAAAAGAGRVEISRATLRWQGQPATVFAYRRGQEPVFLAVVADRSCTVLLTTNA